jgi:two-component system, NarL family, nitrate/nitrite response regulator NarL
VVLLDAALPDGVAVTHAIRARAPHVRVIVMSVADGDVLRFAEAGIAGYVTRDASVAELLAAMDSVQRGESLFSPRAAAALLDRVATLAREPTAAGREPLTAREKEILSLLAAGLSNKEIATRLFIGVPTVKTHVHNILRKLGASRRGQAAARARVLA